MTVHAFPLSRVMDWRDENRRKAEMNRIDGLIHARESEIAKLAHDIWLLKLERSQYEDLPGGSRG